MYSIQKEGGPFKRPPYFDMAEKVFIQSTGHTRRCERLWLLDIARPNEDEEIKAWQQANRRMVTKDIYDNFVNLITRVLSETGTGLKNVSKKLSSFLTEDNFYAQGPCGLDEYMMRYIFPYSIEDPNGAIVPFPYDPDNPETPLAESERPQNQSNSLKFLLVPYYDQFQFSEGGDDLDVFTFKYGQMPILVVPQNEEKWFDVYYIIDDTAIWQYYPVGMKDGYPVYSIRTWYVHLASINEKKIVPVIKLPGTSSRCDSKEKGNVFYNESFMHGAFEWMDEGLQSFMDNVGVRVQHNYPKVLMGNIPCTDCKGGTNMITLKDGSRDVKECTTCKGRGRIINPGPFGVLIKPDRNGLDVNPDDSPYTYLTPPVETINNSLEVAMQFFAKAEESLCLNILERSAESGIAKEIRLEPIQDKLRPIGNGILTTKVKLAQVIECYLEPDEGAREVPTVEIPSSYKIKGIEELQSDVKEALPADRKEREMALYEKLYKGDTVKVMVKKRALEYSPLLSMSDDQITTAINLGAYDSNDYIRMTRAIEAMEYVAEKNAHFVDMKKEEVFRQANEYIAQYLPVAPLGVFGAEESRSPLLDTVGGSTALVEIARAVKDNVLTEAAAINTLTLLFKIDAETARSLIDIPDADTTTIDTEEV